MEPGRILCRSVDADAGRQRHYILSCLLSAKSEVGKMRRKGGGSKRARTKEALSEGASERDDSIENRWCARINQYGELARFPEANYQRSPSQSRLFLLSVLTMLGGLNG